MGVLSSLLPGFRELRAPLAAGYLYLLTAWLLASDLVPRARPPSGPLADLWDLGGIVGTTVVIAAVTFSAYLLGSFMEINPQRLVAGGSAFQPRRTRDPSRLSLLFIPLSAFASAIFSTSLSPFLRGPPLSLSASADLDRLATDAGIPAEYSEGVRSEVIEEMPQLATRLHVKNAEIYGRYDRLVAEGTFRLNVAIPLTLFLSVLAFRTGLAWWLRTLLVVTAVVFGFLLARQGMRRVVAARDIIVQAISIPDLELESRRLKDFRWRLESIRAVQDALDPNRSPPEYKLEHKRRMREAVVRALRDREDFVSYVGPKSLFDTPEARERSDEQLISLFLGATADVDQYVLKTGAPANRTGISMFDQVLRQLDQIDEEPPKRPDDKMPLSPG